MPILDEILTQKLQILEAKAKKRSIIPSVREDGVFVLRGKNRLVSFSCNDYLGLSFRPEVIEAAVKATQKYGSGAGASRLITGSNPLYEELETLLAKYKKTEAAVVFGSGYLANIGTIPALVGKNDLIIADKFSHACIIDAANISGATLLRFAHNNINHCRMLLEENRKDYQNCLIVTEEVFSMDGDLAPLHELEDLAKENGAWLMTDGAHSILSINNNATVKMGTLSKAFAAYGGYICGSNILIEYLKNSARSLIFSTGLPPAVIAAATAAVRILLDEPEIAGKAMENARMFTTILNLPEAQSQIIPLVLQENDKVISASSILAENGFLVSAIRPPTVPENTARLRFTFSSLHTEKQIEELCNIIKKQGLV